MIGSLITRGLVLIFGYVYPAYECFKSVEMNKPDTDQLRFWCQYWILVAGLTVCERIGDMFIGWVPMYGEAKLAFFIYLWFPKTKGTTYVYDSFFKPYVSKHETEIDRNLLEFRIRAGDMAVSYWQKAASYSQTRIFEVLQYIASQSTPRQPTQPQQTGRVQKPDGQSNRGSAIATQLQNGQPSSSRASNAPSSEDTPEEGGPSEDSTANATPTASNKLKTTLTPSIIESKTSSISGEGQVMEIDSVSSVPKETAQPSTQEILLEDAIRVTRARSRRSTRAASNLPNKER